jgi:phosphatidylserine decarboxylase
MVKEGYKFGLPPLVLAVALLCLDKFGGVGGFWPGFAAGVFGVLAVFIFFFFRDPDRIIPTDPDAVVSPGDGHILEVLDEPMGALPGQRITIFLSVFDVHVNRSPVAGKIVELEYRPGKFYAAMRKRASEQNEMNVITVATPRGNIVFKQIAGAIARRVLCWKGIGDTVALGERVGMIRFGSRVDLWLPKDAEILVRRGQKVAGGSSILAKWKSTV